MSNNYVPNSIEEIRELFLKLDQLDLKNAEVDHVKNELRILDNYVIDTIILPVGTNLYRGVKYDTKPSCESEVTYPDPDKVTKYQRANRPHTSIFYCSGTIDVPFFEIGLVPGDHVAISKWQVKEKIIVRTIGYIHKEVENGTTTRKVPNLTSKLDNYPNSEQSKLIYQSLSEAFSKVVKVDHDYKHKITVAIAELALEGQLNLKDGAITECAGIIYPTIAGDGYGENLAIKPAIVDRALRLTEVQYLRVVSQPAEREYYSIVVDSAADKDADGTLKWMGIPHVRISREANG